jgi:DNA polymerase III sliding clamp (beta) subunit (PCNA family)
MTVAFSGNAPEAGPVGINPVYLKEVLGALDTARVYFEWEDGNPLLFHGAAGANYYDGLRVIMPMRV